MKVPVGLRIAALAIATTGFYTYVGQLVPQKEVQPPAETTIEQGHEARPRWSRSGARSWRARGSASPATPSARRAAAALPRSRRHRHPRRDAASRA